MQSQREQSVAAIKRTGIIAIIRGEYSMERVLAIGDALLAGGVGVLEVTLNSHDALTAITSLRRRFEDAAMLVGAGTVRSVGQVDAALAAGAQFIVAPNFDPAAVARSQAHNLLHLPGILTPTEAHNAQRAGCEMVKLFPADTFGPAYLKALRAPLNDIAFVPTGGIDASNIEAYVQVGAVAVGVGGALVAGPHQPLEDVVMRAKALRLAWDQARREH